jgi:hypothetical protein
MSNLDDKHIEHLAKLQAIENPEVHKWYGWGSPMGLIIFFNGMALFAILIRYMFLMK